jgi:hypothetical protein
MSIFMASPRVCRVKRHYAISSNLSKASAEAEKIVAETKRQTVSECANERATVSVLFADKLDAAALDALKHASASVM